jgi:hypothetical protein
MPKEFLDCIAALKREGKGGSAYAICTAKYKERHGGKTPQEDEAKHTIDITVSSLEGVKQVEIKPIDESKGVWGVFDGEEIKQYRFSILNPAEWNYETIANFIQSRKAGIVLQSILSCRLGEPFGIKQADYLPSDIMADLTKVDSDPFFVPIEVKCGLGSRKQFFDENFFKKAGPKFETTSFMLNHSDLTEYGKAIPIGSIVKYAGADASQAKFIAYVSGSEGTLRQKIRESQALKQFGFVKKVSIEGIPFDSDYTVDKETGIKHFHDLTMPTGISIVIKEGLKGSQIAEK